MSLVLDASAAIAALVDTDHDGDWAANLIAGEQILVPELFYAESANILRRYLRAEVLSEAEADAAYEDILDLAVTKYGYAPFAERIWELRHNVTPYDAWYVAIAEMLDAPLVTLDGRLANAPGPQCEFIVPPNTRR